MCACRLLPGHHQPILLSLGPGPIPSQNHRPTLVPIQLQSRRRRILIVHGHVQENGMRGAGGHEDAASREPSRDRVRSHSSSPRH
jgi:hypothetical protein